MTTRIWANFAYIVICVLAACKGRKVENCNDPANSNRPNYDSCIRYKDINADFSMKEILAIDADRTWEVETDTCLSGNTMKFSVKSNDLDSIVWLIGSEVFRETVVYKRGFPDGRSVPITLIAFFKSHAGCTNNSRGIDTVVKYLAAESNPWDAPINGVYAGSNTDAPDDEFTIQVSDTTSNSGFTGGGAPVELTPYPRTGCIQQLPKGAPDLDIKGNHVTFGGKAFFYDERTPGDGPVADYRSNFYLRSYGTWKNGLLKVVYIYDENGLSNYLHGTKYTRGKDVSKIFVGRKIRFY